MKRMILLPLTSLALAACGEVTSVSAPTTPPRVASTAVTTAPNPTFGSVLTTAEGRTLYYFTPERGGTIACTGQCAQIWLPLITPSGLLSTPAALPGTLSTLRRTEGAQVTYSEWPLYTYSGDGAAGDTSGQGVLGQWFVATTTLTDAPIAAATPSATPAPPAPTQAAAATVPPAPYHPAPAPTSCIPGMNGGDHDGDNNGGPNDLDGLSSYPRQDAGGCSTAIPCESPRYAPLASRANAAGCVSATDALIAPVAGSAQLSCCAIPSTSQSALVPTTALIVLEVTIGCPVCERSAVLRCST